MVDSARGLLPRAIRDPIKNCHKCDDAEFARIYLMLANGYRSGGETPVFTARDIRSKMEAARAGQSLDDLRHLEVEETELLAKAERLFQKARDYYLEALKLKDNPQLDETLVELGNLYFFDLHKPDLAVEQYLRLSREASDPRYVPLAYFLLGEIRFEDGNWRWAEQLYDVAAKLDPAATLPCTFYKKAWVQYRRGYPYLARKTFKKCEKFQDVPTRADRVRKACVEDAKRLDPSKAGARSLSR
jgi:tetratricopeptide (TPR) repeat protein